MPRHSGDRRLLRAIFDGVAEMHRRHEADGAFDTKDLIAWLDGNRSDDLNDVYELFLGSRDAELKVEQQIGAMIEALGQVKIGERSPARQLSHGNGDDRSENGKVSLWQVSEAASAGLSRSRDTLLGPGAPTDDWIGRISGSMEEYPEFEEVIRLGRAFRRGELDVRDVSL